VEKSKEQVKGESGCQYGQLSISPTSIKQLQTWTFVFGMVAWGDQNRLAG
jgi:hypothetical protein